MMDTYSNFVFSFLNDNVDSGQNYNSYLWTINKNIQIPELNRFKKGQKLNSKCNLSKNQEKLQLEL